MPTSITITAWVALALAALAGLALVLNKIHTDVMPAIANLVSDFRGLHEAVALTRQQADTNTARLNGQSAKIDTLMLAAPPAVASALPPAPAPLPPEVVDAMQQLSDHAASITAAVADINKSRQMSRSDLAQPDLSAQQNAAPPTTGGAVIIGSAP